MLERMTFFAKLFNVGDESGIGMWLLYGMIIVLSVIVYNLGFARKLPLLKNVVIYIMLVLGCSILTFFAVFLPITEGLIVAAVVLGIYKVRLYQAKREQAN